ncbi:hypothetical protein GCM10010129_81990 [Streptomyces fumigatiscleroticus]|nr:hypothetical protein GCM10010129_81990 [Streptomyces fumigatiscleroticus]
MTSQSAAPLRTRLVEQAASDLEENRRRQQELAERITVLKQEEALLADILNLAERYEGFADPSRLPEQLQDEPVVAKAKRVSAETGASRTASKAAASGDAGKAGAKGKSRRPLLGDLLMELLGKHEGPRLAKELRDELLVKHPDRNPTPQVVRNTLEALVAKGRIQRHKQQRSVMYTLVEPDSAG